MEKLCTLQWKFSPLRDCSPEFLRDHPNPHIKDYIDLAKSPNARIGPRFSSNVEFTSDMQNAVGKIWAGKESAVDALNEVQGDQQKALNKSQARWKRIAEKLTEAWSKQ